MKTIRSISAVLAVLVALGVSTESGDLVLGGRDANAVVGRPATPASYAGVARRTTRRTVRRTAYATAPAQQTTVVINTLPSGCQQNGDVYVCGTTQYQEVFDGDTVVYQQM